jgi:hypothetical protein
VLTSLFNAYPLKSIEVSHILVQVFSVCSHTLIEIDVIVEKSLADIVQTGIVILATGSQFASNNQEGTHPYEYENNTLQP